MNLDQALARIAVLEDALAEFAPFARADDVDLHATFTNADPATVANFKRDIAYCDLSMFQRAAELTGNRFR